MNAGTVKRSIRAVAANARHPLRLVNVARNRLNRGSPEVPPFLPYSLDVEPTTRCNLRCPMCLHTYWDREPGDMSPETFRRLLDGAPQLVKLKLQGMGEPLLSPHFFDLIAEAVGGHRPSREQINEAAARCREADAGRTTVIVLTRPEGGGAACRWPWHSAFVTSDGYVTPCCGMMDPRQFNLGNINEQGFGDIWRGPAYRELRRRILANDLPPACRAICGAPPKRDNDGRSE